MAGLMDFLVQGEMTLNVSKMVSSTDEGSALQKMYELFNALTSQVETITYKDENGELHTIKVDDLDVSWEEATNAEEL
ncbi:hypothetical protein [Priestia megaterium]|uniref:hypothetical protein n=1 Tax=Priestia megaterium TaxID=1404 RepID=UPI00112DAD73|nr:hypothetical protein [Priestia megaterium]TPF18046.1 hypothetical protein CBE78_02125 [Priestia megaterium]TPF22153.1 hypothetical protein CBE79_04630 [Priestia megaterium]